MSFTRFAFRSAVRPTLMAASAPRIQFLRYSPRAAFSAAAGLPKSEIEARILDLLKSFEKVDPAKLTLTSTFTSDLGLDSLDAVEVVMAVEEEFSIEIPDAEADEIKTVQQAVEYIAKTPEAR